MAKKKKRKLTKEEKAEIKRRASLGRLCRPGCTLIVFGREMSARVRHKMYESGIRVVFTNDISEVMEFLETAATLEIPTTLFIRSAFSEDSIYFTENIEPLLAYAGEWIEVRIYGHTVNDNVLDKLGIREDDKDDRAFYSLVNEWSPYCGDSLGYGNRMKVLAANEKKAEETAQKVRIKAEEVMMTPYDPFSIMENLAKCAEVTEDAS